MRRMGLRVVRSLRSLVLSPRPVILNVRGKMKLSIVLLLVFHFLGCTSRREKEMMELREVTIEQLDSMVEGRKNELRKSGGKLMYMGSWRLSHSCKNLVMR